MSLQAGPVRVIKADGTIDIQQPYSDKALRNIRSTRGAVAQGSRIALYKRDKGHCRYCHAPLGVDKWVPDFVVPIAFGGSNLLGNIVVSCMPCHDRKDHSVWEPRPIFGTRTK